MELLQTGVCVKEGGRLWYVPTDVRVTSKKKDRLDIYGFASRSRNYFRTWNRLVILLITWIVSIDCHCPVTEGALHQTSAGGEDHHSVLPRRYVTHRLRPINCSPPYNKRRGIQLASWLHPEILKEVLNAVTSIVHLRTLFLLYAVRIDKLIVMVTRQTPADLILVAYREDCFQYSYWTVSREL